MSFDVDIALELSHVSKYYHIFEKPIDRLLSMLPWNKTNAYGQLFWALRDITLTVKKGEVIGIIGRNGAGKSTLLQLICQTLQPTEGVVKTSGKIAALLELGSGFNPEFSGRENIFLAAAIAGMSKDEIASKYHDIVAFSEIEAFIDQPVKTYSSGMLMRLAFSVATSIEPEILIIDEALSVGDGAFARKSFDRIMKLKESGVTILFCSHSLFQVEALCERVIWMEKGSLKMMGKASDVIPPYEISLEEPIQNNDLKSFSSEHKSFRFLNVTVSHQEPIRSNIDTLGLTVEYTYDVLAHHPTIIYEIFTETGQTVSSGISKNDGAVFCNQDNGKNSVEITFPQLPLMRGRYRIDLYLMCEQTVHLYDHASSCVIFDVIQEHHEKGIVFLEHTWKQL